MKNKKQIVSALILSAILIPQIALASWWNPSSWFTNKQEQSQGINLNNVASEPQITGQNNEFVKKQSINTQTAKGESPITTIANNQSEEKTINELRADVATLKISLDSLYKAHNSLVKNYDNFLGEFELKNKGLLKELDDAQIIGLNQRVRNLENKTSSNFSIPNSSDLEARVKNLENTMDNVCQNIFSGLIGCPSALIGTNLENRIRTLERGY